MVAVALDKSLQQSEVFIVDTCQTVLVDDQYTLPVTDVELCRSGGVMGRAIGITAQLLQSLDTPGHQCLGDGCSYTGMILVQVETLELQWLTVEQEPLVGIEGNLTKTGRGLIDVGHHSTNLHDGLHLI